MNNHPKTLSPLKIVFLASLGQGLEYYDFVLFGLMAEQLGTQFFPSADKSSMMIQSFLLFSMGYFVRPLGGFVFGRLADRKGRKYAFPIIMFMMAFSTACIGLLPTYQSAGYWAIVGLALCRLLQGLSYGAELPNAATIVHEFSESSKQGKMTAILLSSTSIGALSATLVLFLLNQYFTPEDITAGVWRVPFLFGGILGLIAWYTRSRLRETPVFQKAVEKNGPKHLPSVFSFRKILYGIGLTLFLSNLVVSNIYMPTFIHQIFGTSLQDIYRSMSVSMMATPFYMMFFGYLSDRIRRKSILWVILLSFLLLIIPLFQMLKTSDSYALQFYFLVYQIWVSAFFVTYLPILTSFFDVHQRSTGLGICYNVAYSLASTFPALINFWAQDHFTWLTPTLLLGNFILCSLISMFCLGFGDLTKSRVSKKN